MTATLARTRPMTVGELSRRTGVPIKTLRQYTDWGLIYTEGRSPTNYRLYTTDALWCVQLISQLRGLGLTVAEIRELTHADQPIGPRLAALLQHARMRITQRLTDLRQTLHRIDEFEATHQTDLAGQSGGCWMGDPRCAPSAQSDVDSGRPWGA